MRVAYFSILLLVLACPAFSSVKVTLYENKRHCCTAGCGPCERIHIGDNVCLPLRDLDNKVASINTHDTCAKVWETGNCQGNYKIIRPGSDCDHGDLSHCSWDKRISSISGCLYDPKVIISNSLDERSKLEDNQCIDGTWLKEIYLKPYDPQGLELFCGKPGDIPQEILKISHTVNVSTIVSTTCDVMRGISINFITGEIRSICEYEEDFLSEGAVFAAFCANLDSAVCGLQLVKSEGGSIINGKPICCTVPNPGSTCTPKENVYLLKDCDNRYGSTPLECHYEKSMGIVALESKKTSFYSKFYTGYTVGSPWRYSLRGKQPIQTVFHELVESFKMHLGQHWRLGYNWGEGLNSVWMAEATQLVTLTVTNVSLVVRPGERVKVGQVVGECGFFRIHTNQTIIHTTHLETSSVAGVIIGILILVLVVLIAGVLFIWKRPWKTQLSNLTHRLGQVFHPTPNPVEVSVPNNVETTSVYELF